ncbi:coiled-coil domain-containing protein 180-like isoform X1 [Acipenser ruthenus]|uniref:coiled-coil domain-containing protein 180-like isoform X1 n=1 Tax=Acipenser ruthenus TaxID=7906 RepID=UPI00274161FC|nr:coiled-coil domain-containing protein 180-like isoform X1 [Acipenser ruthenus]XP_058842923.1 coiled-coil domain-containing protein 180-like isoform X1 [Acipenser ruthenus]
MGDVHVVRSGKVYRQLFDAEVQLVKALGEARSKSYPYGVSLDSGKIPLVRDLDTAAGGILSQRQRQWVQEMPNNTSTENPVLHREEVLSALRRAKESEDVLAAREVRGLSDPVVAEKPESDIIQRLSLSKQQRHEDAVSNLQQELILLSEDFEPMFMEAGEALLDRLSESDGEIQQVFQKIENDSDLERFTLEGLHNLWDSITHISLERRKWIKDLDETCISYESKRAARIGNILKAYTGTLEKISYLMPSDVYRFIDKESMMLNQALLANRRAVGKLYVNLMERDLKRELSERRRWKERLQDWKTIKRQAALVKFNNFMSSIRNHEPEAVQRELDLMRKTQELMSERRMKILLSLSDISPPQCTKSMASEWNSSLSAINEQIDAMHIDYMKRIHSHYENLWQDCLEEVEKFKEEMLSNHVLSQKDIQYIVNNELLQLVGSCQRQREEELEAMEKEFEVLANTTRDQNKALLKFARGAADLWELHSAGLARKEHLFQNKLDEIRFSHDQENQAKEASLDILMDKLRQESTEETLKSAMEKTFSYLEEIKTSYLHFHQKQVDVVESYPAMVKEELLEYCTAVSGYFNVREIFKQEEESILTSSSTSENLGVKLEKHKRRSTSAAIQDVLSRDKKRSTTTAVQSGSLPKRVNTPSPKKDASLTDQKKRKTESEISSKDDFQTTVFTTSSGNSYTLTCPEDVMCEYPSQGKPPPYVETVVLTSSLLSDLIRRTRQEFFEHMEHWFDKAMSNSMNIVAAKKDELKSELELRYHLHQPRAQRIEMDIHNVRAAELVLHRERVDRHCTGVIEGLNNVKSEFVTLRAEQKKLTEGFRKYIYDMEDVFVNATKSEWLASLCDSLHTDLDKHMGIIRASLRQFREKQETTLGKLRDSNAEFIKSVRLFSEGGNFTPDEFEVFRKRLDKISGRIDNTEEFVMLELEGMESKCLGQATEVVHKFEDKFHNLTVDLNFIEKIQRFLINTQVKMKLEVTKSNYQAESLSSYLEQFQKKIDACAKPRVDKETVTPDELYSFTQMIMEEFKKRSTYLDCLLDLPSASSVPEIPLQGPFAAATRSERQESKVGSQSCDGLLQPSRMGKPATEDAALGVIHSILQTQKSKVYLELEKAPEASGVQLSSPHSPSTTVLGDKKSHTSSINLKTDILLRKASSAGVKRFSKPTRFDKRFQVFGSKPEEEQLHFKGIVWGILWESNDALLLVAEEFYKKKEKRTITRPEYIQETFENSAEMLNQKLLSYHSQAEEYHNVCLQDFREQLKQFEQQLYHVPPLLIAELTKKHLDQLAETTAQIHHSLHERLQESINRQTEHWDSLRPTLGHPGNLNQLESLCNLEQERLTEHLTAIDISKKNLQDCVIKHGEDFVTALASLTENMLLKLDDFLTVDDIQTGTVEVTKAKTTTLIRRKKAGLPLEDRVYIPLTQRGSRTWPGILYYEPRVKINDEKLTRETASIKTAKTTLGHVSAMEARDSAYQKYQREYEKELARTEEEPEAQRISATHQETRWKESVLKIKQLYS